MFTASQNRATLVIMSHVVDPLSSLAANADLAIEQCDDDIALTNECIDRLFSIIDADMISSDDAQLRYNDYSDRLKQLRQRRVNLVNAKGQL